MARISLVDIAESEDEKPRAIAQEFIEYKGSVPNHYRIEGHIPGLVEQVYHAHDAVYEGGDLSVDLLRTVAVAVSMDNDCGYCTGAYCSLLAQDHPDDDVIELQEAIVSDGLSDTEGAIVDFALTINDDPHAVTDGTIRVLREEHDLGPAELLQIVYQVNLVAGYNRLTTVFDAEYDHGYPERFAER